MKISKLIKYLEEWQEVAGDIDIRYLFIIKNKTFKVKMRIKKNDN